MSYSNERKKLAEDFIGAAMNLKGSYLTREKRPLMGYYANRMREKEFINVMKGIASSITKQCDYYTLCEIKSIVQFYNNMLSVKLKNANSEGNPKYKFIIQDFTESYSSETGYVSRQICSFYCYNRNNNRELSVSIDIPSVSPDDITFRSYSKKVRIYREYIRTISGSLQEKIKNTDDPQLKENLLFMIECLSIYIVELGFDIIDALRTEYYDRRKKRKENEQIHGFFIQ